MYNRIRHHAPRYRSLVRNMFLTIITVSFVPVSLVSLLIYMEFRTLHREKVMAHLTELVSNHKIQIDDYLNARRADIRFLAESFGNDNLSRSDFLEGLLMRLQRDYGPVFVDLGVIDANGDQVSYAGPFRLGNAHYTDSQWFKQTMPIRLAPRVSK
jgi:two-component system NtrC family sensor kinase